MTLETDPITCTGCTRLIKVAELCIHSAPTCCLCCGKHCGAGEPVSLGDCIAELIESRGWSA